MAKLKSKPHIIRVPHSAPGTAPGTLNIANGAARPVVSVLSYGPEELYEQENVTALASLCELLERYPVTWVNFDGIGDADMLNEMGRLFGVHRLALEDIVNVPQRPKIENYGEDLFVVLRMVLVHEHLEFEQVSLYLGRNFVLTFHEGRLEDNLGRVRERIHKSIYRIRTVGADYLAYAVIDAVIDGFFPVLEDYSEKLELLEDKVLSDAEKSSISQIHDVRRDLLTLRRGMWPLRESLSSLLRETPSIIAADTRPFLRDCADHAGQILDLIESQRELCAGMMDVYLSSASNRMNEIMKFLTMMSAIFIPLSFVAGVYGMNFDPEYSQLNMPELRWLYGYPFTLALMTVIAAGLMVFFRRKGWL